MRSINWIFLFVAVAALVLWMMRRSANRRARGN